MDCLLDQFCQKFICRCSLYGLDHSLHLRLEMLVQRVNLLGVHLQEGNHILKFRKFIIIYLLS